MDRIVALRDVREGHPATKTHTRNPDGSWADPVAYTMGREFRWAVKELGGFDDLADVLAKVGARSEWFVVRGDVAPNAPDTIPRTYKPEGSWITDADRRWLCVDIDDARADPERCHIAQALELLPSWLRDARCVWQYSSSHGVKAPTKIPVHLC